MMTETLITRLKRFHQRINGSTIEYDLTPYFRILDEIKKYESKLKKKSDCQLKQISQQLIASARKNSGLDGLLVEACALVREAVKSIN